MEAIRMRLPPLRMVVQAIVRTVVFALMWWLLTHGAGGSWFIGVPAVVAATGLSLILAPDPLPRPHFARLPTFALYFIRESVAGGIDVVKRALHPNMPLAPGFIDVKVDRLSAPQRLVFAILVSLMPGTLSTRLEGDSLRVHVLDVALPVSVSLKRLERELVDLFDGPLRNTESRP